MEKGRESLDWARKAADLRRFLFEETGLAFSRNEVHTHTRIQIEALEIRNRSVFRHTTLREINKTFLARASCSEYN